jgi:hypothetical protein
MSKIAAGVGLLGIILAVMGVATLILGSLTMTVLGLWHIASAWATLTAVDVFIGLVFILLRDLVAVVAGGVMFVVGFIMITIAEEL